MDLLIEQIFVYYYFYLCIIKRLISISKDYIQHHFN